MTLWPKTTSSSLWSLSFQCWAISAGRIPSSKTAELGGGGGRFGGVRQRQYCQWGFSGRLWSQVERWKREVDRKRRDAEDWAGRWNSKPFFFFFFFQFLGLNSGPIPWATPQALFCDGYFRDRVSWTICSGWLWTLILLICASWIARITGVSHRCRAKSVEPFITHSQTCYLITALYPSLEASYWV
jgi:hypothetical protein